MAELYMQTDKAMIYNLFAHNNPIWIIGLWKTKFIKSVKMETLNKKLFLNLKWKLYLIKETKPSNVPKLWALEGKTVLDSRGSFSSW